MRRAIPHPRYNNMTQANDIMLLQVGPAAALTPGPFHPGPCIPCDLIPDPPPVPPLRGPRAVRRQPHDCPAAYVGHQQVRMLVLYLQLSRKAYMTDAVSPINLPRRLEKLNPGKMCSVAGWGRLDVDMPSADKLQEVDLEVQKDEKCIARFKDYSSIMQICAGDPNKRKSSYSVRSSVLSV